MLESDPTTLLVRVQAGDASAFEQLVAPHAGRLYRIAMAYTHDAQDALDVVQDTLLNAFRSLGTLRDVASFEGWLCRIAVNHGRMLLRSRRRRPTIAMEDMDHAFDETGERTETVPAWTVRPDDALERRRLVTRIAALAEDLPEPYHDVWVLCDVEQMTMKEAAHVLEIGVPNVKTRLHRARLAIRDRLAVELLGKEGGR